MARRTQPAIPDNVLDEVAVWQNRSLETVYPIVFFDALQVKIRDEGVVRNEAVHIAMGVRADGTKKVLGLWIEQNDGAKFWLRVMNELRHRGVEDMLMIAQAIGSFGIAAVKPVSQRLAIHATHAGRIRPARRQGKRPARSVRLPATRRKSPQIRGQIVIP